MQIMTQTEKHDVVISTFKSLTTIRAFLNSVESFSDVESMFQKFQKCFDEAKAKEEARLQEESQKINQALVAKAVLDDMGISIEEFNKLMVRTGHIGAITLSESQAETPQPKAKAKPKTRANAVYVFEFEFEGSTHRTILRPVIGRKSKEMSAYMKSLGLDPYNKEDCLQLAVAPTQAEINQYLRNGGDESLIQHLSTSAQEGSVEAPEFEEEEEIDVDHPEENFGNQ